MLGRDSQCVRVLIPDDDVGYQAFHDVVLEDRTEEDAPYVVMSDLSALRQQWSYLVISGMTNRQCKKKYCGTPQRGYVHSVEKLSGWICFDMWQIIIWNSASSGDAQCHGAPNGRVHHRTVLIISGWFIRFQLR